MSSERNQYAAANVPLQAFVILGIAYLIMMSGLALFAAHDGITRLIMLFATAGVIPIFVLPIWMLKGDRNYERSSMDQFMDEGINIEHGHATGPAALTQMLLVPVCVWVFLLGILLFA
jgi:hypothetical protein